MPPSDVKSPVMHPIRLFLILTFSLAFLLAPNLKIHGQDEDKVIRVDTELAEFEVLVEDREGRPVHGLRAEDFRILENGKPQRIDFFQPVRSVGKNRPMVIVFAVDVSGSMTPAEIEKLRSAITGFVDRFGDYESYFALVSFAMEVKKIQSFSNRPDVLKRSLAKFDRDQEGRSTHAFDAVDASIRMIDKNAPKSLLGRAPKKAIVLITDGFPVGDTVSPETVIERANNAGTSVYSVILPSFSPIQRDARPIMVIQFFERRGSRPVRVIRNESTALPQVEPGPDRARKSGEIAIRQIRIHRIVSIVLDTRSKLKRCSFKLEFFETERREGILSNGTVN